MSLKKRLTALLVGLLLASLLSVPAFAADTQTNDISIASYMYSSKGGYYYNSQDAFQRVFGFNATWDFLSPLAATWNDTLRCKFTYDGRDWLVQLWKGAYGYGIFTGGEIGIYNKPTSRSIEHYNAAAEQDWITMGMTIYYNGEKLLSRPLKEQWWCTGFKQANMSGVLKKPRANCIMEATLQFKDAGMAQAFANALAGKGFALAKGALTIQTPERYTLSGTTVNLVWQMANEGIW